MLSETVTVFTEIAKARNGSVANRVAGSVEVNHFLVGYSVQDGDLLVELNRDLLQIRAR